MKLSQQKRDALYAAIREPIVDYRVRNMTHETPALDYTIAQLEHAIWSRVCEALEIERNQIPKARVRR